MSEETAFTESLSFHDWRLTVISLVMTTYNGEKYLEEQLDSIRDQTRKPDEVLIFDDCSTDNTAELVRKYIERNKIANWVFTVNEKNKGYSRNFTDGIKTAVGDIVFLADQDDIWYIDKIEKMCAVMDKNPQIELLASNVDTFYTGTSPQKINFEWYCGELVKIKNRKKWIKPARPGCSMCFRKSLMDDYDELWFPEYAHDCLLWGLAVFKGSAYLYNKSTLRFRRHDTNASSRGRLNMAYRLKGLETEIKIINHMVQISEKKNLSQEQFVKKQRNVYCQRKKILEQKNVLRAIMMLKNLRYYARTRYWLTDIFYCMKR